MATHDCSSRRNLDAAALLKANRLKVTEIRVLLLTLLHAGRQPQSAEELYAELSTSVKKAKSRKTVDLVTVYRNLKSFMDAGLIQSTELGTGRKLYEWLDQSHHHHHVICKTCARVDTLEICGLDQHLKSIQKLGYASVGHRLEFFGTCRKCQSPSPKSVRSLTPRPAL